MKTIIHTQEILIVHHHNWFTRELEEKDKETNRPNYTPNEKLAEACWNGLLSELVPEICTHLSLNEINETYSFLELKYGGFASHFDKSFSINPYVVLDSYCEN